MYRTSSFAMLIGLIITGCGQGYVIDDVEADYEAKGSIIGKTTQEVGEFDPNAGRKVSDSKVRASNPLTGALEAYGPMVEKITKLSVDKSLQMYNATNGYYPKTHQQFMDEVVKGYGLKLPVLPAGAQYQYDVANHKLVVVKAEGR